MIRSIRKLPTIHVKVALAPTVALVGLVAVAAMAWFGNRHLASEFDRVSTDAIANVLAAESLGLETARVHQRIHQSLTWEAVGQRPAVIAELDQALDQEEVHAALEREADAETKAALQTMAESLKTCAKTAVDTLDIETAGVATAASAVVTPDKHHADIQKQVGLLIERSKAESAAEVTMAQASARRQNLAAGGVALLLGAPSGALGGGGPADHAAAGRRRRCGRPSGRG